jgi:hypothetical protein
VIVKPGILPKPVQSLIYLAASRAALSGVSLCPHSEQATIVRPSDEVLCSTATWQLPHKTGMSIATVDRTLIGGGMFLVPTYPLSYVRKRTARENFNLSRPRHVERQAKVRSSEDGPGLVIAAYRDGGQ